ncbi:MAG: L-carnitine dehydratase/bile acid-inducible protein [Acidimicrobiia bacterium]|nr:L-carnitine dehydratase/bile acid-inducible protein [Acidimicrobiia bacterium]
MPGPLAHLKVLDLSRMYPGALCTLLLADLGADVLKVEAPGFGDGMRAMAPPGAFNSAHVAFNRGKRSLTLDVKHPGAAAVLKRLVAGVDIVVESQRPGALDQLGIGYEALRKVNPGLIWCSITGFGHDSPDADKPGHDITYLGYSGALSELAAGGPLPVSDITVAVPMGAMMAITGILAAVAQRAHTGAGAFVDASIVDSAMWLLSESVARAASAPGPTWPPFAARGAYRCADGRFVTVASSEPRPWALLCAALELPDLLDHVMGVDEAEAIERVAAAFARQPSHHWLGNPGLTGGVGPVNRPQDLLADAHVAARGSIVEAGGVPVLANPIRIQGVPTTLALGAPPALGQHTDAALRAAGFSEQEIATLRSESVV